VDVRKSKQPAELQDRTEGKRAGREWAEEKAEHAQLRRVSEIPLVDSTSPAIDLEHNLTNEEVVKYMFDNDAEPTDQYIEGFIKRAQEFFAEVRNCSSRAYALSELSAVARTPFKHRVV
jgi:hypothetical protein